VGGAIAHPPFSGWQRAAGAYIGVTHGASGGIAPLGFQHVMKEKKKREYFTAV